MVVPWGPDGEFFGQSDRGFAISRIGSSVACHDDSLRDPWRTMVQAGVSVELTTGSVGNCDGKSR